MCWKVKEASEVVRSSLVQAFDGIRKFYDDKLVIGTVKVGQEKTLRRERRQATTPIFGAEANDTVSTSCFIWGNTSRPVFFSLPSLAPIFPLNLFLFFSK